MDKRDFARSICPMPNNYCNGKSIPDREEPAPELGKCPWFITGKCSHILHPDNQKEKSYR
jgi:hypothetical protein